MKLCFLSKFADQDLKNPRSGGSHARVCRPAVVAFTPDSKSVIGGSAYSGIVRTRELATGKETQRFTVSPNGIFSMISSPDGARLAIVARRLPARGDLDFEMHGDGHVHLFDIVMGCEIADMEVPGIDQYRLIFSPDGKVLFAGRDKKGGFLTWDAATGKALGSRSFEWVSSPIFLALALSSDGKLAAVGDWSCVRLFDRVTGQAVSPPAGHTGGVKVMALAADGFQAATSSLNEGKIILWNRATGEMLHELDASPQRLCSHLYSHDGRTLYSSSLAVRAPTPPGGKEPVQNGLQAWNTTTGKMIWSQEVTPSQTVTLALSPDGRALAVAGNNQVALFEAATGKPIRTLALEGELGLIGQAGPNTSLLFTPDGSELLAWGISKGIHRWEVATGNHVTLTTDQVQLGITGATVASFSPDAKLLVLGAWADHLLIVDAATGKEVNRIKGVSNDHAGGPLAIAFSPHGRTLAWGGPADGKVRLVDPATGATIRELAADSGRAISLHFSADGKTLAAGYANSSALIWDLREAPRQK